MGPGFIVRPVASSIHSVASRWTPQVLLWLWTKTSFLLLPIINLSGALCPVLERIQLYALDYPIKAALLKVLGEFPTG
jgi:hypothetical protein